MANGYIPASRLTAFSDDGLNSGPEQARLGVNIRWSGGNPGANSLNDYHQVDFGRVVMLTGIATQGDPGSPNDFVKKFYLKISNSSSSFTEFKDCSAVRKVCSKKLLLPSSLTLLMIIVMGSLKNIARWVDESFVSYNSLKETYGYFVMIADGEFLIS